MADDSSALSENSVAITYTEISKLGIPNEFMEYDANMSGSEMVSVIHAMENNTVEQEHDARDGSDADPETASTTLLSEQDIDYLLGMAFTDQIRQDILNIRDGVDNTPLGRIKEMLKQQMASPFVTAQELKQLEETYIKFC